MVRKNLTNMIAAGVLVLGGATGANADVLNRDITSINYHKNVVGEAESKVLGQYDLDTSDGLFGDNIYVLTIEDVNTSLGTGYSSFQQAVEDLNGPFSKALGIQKRAKLESQLERGGGDGKGPAGKGVSGATGNNGANEGGNGFN